MYKKGGISDFVTLFTNLNYLEGWVIIIIIIVVLYSKVLLVFSLNYDFKSGKTRRDY